MRSETSLKVQLAKPNIRVKTVWASRQRPLTEGKWARDTHVSLDLWEVPLVTCWLRSKVTSIPSLDSWLNNKAQSPGWRCSSTLYF